MALFHSASAAAGFRPDNGVLNFGSALHSVGGDIGFVPGTKGVLSHHAVKTLGSDLGLMVIDSHGEESMLKTGVPTSLMASQIITHLAKGEDDQCLRKLGFIVGDYTRAANLGDDTYKAANKRLGAAFEKFAGSDLAKKLVAKVKRGERIDVVDANQVLIEIAKADPKADEEHSAGNILAGAVYASVVHGTAGQVFSNAFQSRELASEYIPTQRLLVGINPGFNPMMSSKMLEGAGKATVHQFDEFLVSSFRQAKEQGAAADSDTWIEEGKKSLEAKLTNMNGLVSAVLVRLLMGEGADLNPDNMLLLETPEGKFQPINVDVTGFRFPRQNDRGTTPGWETLLKQTDTDALLQSLFKSDIFQNRYIKRLNGDWQPDHIRDKITLAVGQVLMEHCKEDAQLERQSVVDWLSQQAAEQVSRSFSEFAKTVQGHFPEGLRPSDNYVEALAKRGVQSFIVPAIETAQALVKEQDATAKNTAVPGVVPA